MGNQPVKKPEVETNKNQVPVIHVEYCNSWGYYSKFLKVKELILLSYPKAQITSGIAKKLGGFEITVNGKLIHSKIGGDGNVDTGSNTDIFIEKIKQATEVNK